MRFVTILSMYNWKWLWWMTSKQTVWNNCCRSDSLPNTPEQLAQSAHVENLQLLSLLHLVLCTLFTTCLQRSFTLFFGHPPASKARFIKTLTWTVLAQAEHNKATDEHHTSYCQSNEQWGKQSAPWREEEKVSTHAVSRSMACKGRQETNVQGLSHWLGCSNWAHAVA